MKSFQAKAIHVYLKGEKGKFYGTQRPQEMSIK